MLKLLSKHDEWYIWKYYTIKLKKNEKKALMEFEPRHNGKKNGIYTDSDSTYWAIHADNKYFSKPNPICEYASNMFWLQCLQTIKCGHSRIFEA